MFSGVITTETSTLTSTLQCGFCGTTDKKLSECSRCHFEYYCSIECEKAHMPMHKKACVQEGGASFSTGEGVKITLPLNGPPLTHEQEVDADELICLQLRSLLDGGEGQAICKKMGQAIFDKYKLLADNDSLKGQQAVEDICKWISTNCADGEKRSSHLKEAWKGIGDATWTWK